MKIELTYIALLVVMLVLLGAWYGLRWLIKTTKMPTIEDVQPEPEPHMDDISDDDKISITNCSEQAKYYNGPPSPYDNMK